MKRKLASGIWHEASGNTKGQFFIASAVVIIIAIAAVFFYVAKVEQVNNSGLIQNEMSFFMSNAKEEYGRVAEIVLSNLSRDLTLNPNNYLDGNLSSMDRFVIAQGLERGIIVNVTSLRMSASNSSINASLNLTLYSQGSVVDAKTWVHRAIIINSLNGSLVATPTCTLNVTAKKEFGEPITGLNISDFTFKINTTACASAALTEKSAGKYNATCTSSICISSNVSIEITDKRNIFGQSRVPNTGQGNGCAGTCGQALD